MRSYAPGRLELECGDIGIGLPVTEVLLQGCYHLVGLEVAGYADSYVIRYIIGVVILLYIGDGRVLEVFLAAEGRLFSVRVVREQSLVDSFPDLAAVLGKGHVFLLVDGIKFGVEAADYAVTESVCLNLRPIVDLVGGNLLGINRLVGRSPCVCAVRAYHRHELVIFVWDGIFGGLVAD